MTHEEVDAIETLKQDRETLSTILDDVCDWLKTGQQMGSLTKVCRFCDVHIYRNGWTPDHEDRCPVNRFKEWKDGQ